MSAKKEKEEIEMVTSSPEKQKEELQQKTLEEKIKEEKEALEAKKRKSMNAWGNTGEMKSFGLRGMLSFTLPRLWRGSCYAKFIFIFNVMMIFILKAVNVLVPLVFKEVIDSIVCEEEKLAESDTFLLRSAESGCPTEQETYTIIGLYAVVKFAADFLNYIREIPFANMAAVAEISIAHDVYDHVQRQCLAFHLGRETGKIIRIVSKGAQSFT
jgi:ABC-type multidrug transport system fused ATPase/permease subunit